MSRLLALYREAFQGLTREVWILSIALLLNRCGTMVLTFLVLYLTEERGFTESSAGQLVALYGVGSLIGVWVGGRLADRVGYRGVMLGSLSLTGLGFIGYGYLRDPWAMRMFIVVLGGLAESFRPANLVALSAFSRPDQRARAIALNRLAINLGWGLAPALAGFLAERDYTHLFWIDGGTCLAAAAFLAWALPARPPAQPESEVAADGGDSSPWRDRTFLVFLGLLVLQGLVFFQLQATWPLYLNDVRGYSESAIGLFLTINAVVIVLFEMLLITRIERTSPIVLLSRGSLLMAAGFGLMSVSGSIPWIALLVLSWTLAEMVMFPMAVAWTSRRAGEANRGAYMAAQGMAFSTAMLLAPLWGTWVYEELGPDAVWHVCLALGALSVLGFRALSRVTD